ncbi:hypothetical protein HMN09_00820300 [Mycena chlorophos]|uniref:RlpA-like protein double-psi beta-barrel domain-containing protein n=1 Tax=Mycena chlorophos TaxID=658473 RepID=A0A8H6SVY0_MYCCL|nr:hypothetical protein HMN09_00820300 [Mycena chlorophos]
MLSKTPAFLVAFVLAALQSRGYCSESGCNTNSTAQALTNGMQYNGTASVYTPNGAIGACGTAVQNTDYVVAIGSDNWDNGAHCGETLTVQYTPGGTSIHVLVVDECMGCATSHYAIALTEASMELVDAGYVSGESIPVIWGLI